LEVLGLSSPPTRGGGGGGIFIEGMNGDEAAWAGVAHSPTRFPSFSLELFPSLLLKKGNKTLQDRNNEDNRHKEDLWYDLYL
jgi:hypothetical protein